MTSSKKIVVYANGGAGVNIGKEIQKVFTRLHAEDNTPCAEVQVVFIDTSESDLRDYADRENVFLFEGMDGSGSDRDLNRDEMEAVLPNIFLDFPPGDLNIVINSLGGGSGSRSGPLVGSELLGMGYNVISFGVENDDTISRLKNTVDSLEDYETVAKFRDRVYPVHLSDNGSQSEANVNQEIVRAVQFLAILFSGEIPRLDSADLDHWINYNKIGQGDIGAMNLIITSDLNKIKDDMIVNSVVSLVRDPNVKIRFPRMLEYHPQGVLDNGLNADALHFVLVDGPIQAAHARRKKQLDEATRRTQARVRRVSIGGSNVGSRGVK